MRGRCQERVDVRKGDYSSPPPPQRDIRDQLYRDSGRETDRRSWPLRGFHSHSPRGACRHSYVYNVQRIIVYLEQTFSPTTHHFERKLLLLTIIITIATAV